MKPHLEETIRRCLTLRPRRIINEPNYRRAAVLVPLFESDGEVHVLFTKRSDTVEHHKGQVSFPGGGHDPDDADLLETALRETQEEIGLQASDVRVLGALDDYVTISDFVVSPYVGVIPYPYEFTVSDFEIDEIFTVPVPALLDDDSFHMVMEVRHGHLRPQYFFRADPHVIWGITGRILYQFLDLCMKEHYEQ
jgi:8-oxo-dGTP pyrophosphatase MutT (NUDIX family)